MKSSVKLGKHVEDQRGKGCLDRISSLPDEILGHVLSFLPTRCAVRTSILSTSWRRIFTLTSCLSFDDELCFRGLRSRRQIDRALKESFTEFVYHVLELHQISPIKKFSLVCESIYDKSDLNAWVSNALQKGVQEIHYKLVKQQVDVPDGLLMCETLVSLTMVNDGDYGIEIPLSVWLPNLKILDLAYIKFVDCDSMQRLFSGCKLLEELTLKYCICFESDTDDEGFESDTGDHVIISTGLLKVLTLENCYFECGLFEIDAPNLAYLTYTDNIGLKIAPSWKDSCSLVKAELKFSCWRREVLLEYDREILKVAAYKTTELHLLANSVQDRLTLADQEQMPDFHSLSRLHLGYFRYDSWKYVTSLLDKSPQLEMVIFEEGLHHCFCDPASPPCEPLFPFSCHAQVIEVRRFCGHKGSLLHLGHLLKSARVLKKLIIHKPGSFNLKDELQINKDDLLMLPRASADCCIELKQCNHSPP